MIRDLDELEETERNAGVYETLSSKAIDYESF